MLKHVRHAHYVLLGDLGNKRAKLPRLLGAHGGSRKTDSTTLMYFHTLKSKYSDVTEVGDVFPPRHFPSTYQKLI